MSHDVKKYLFDVINAIELIQLFTSDVEDFFEFKKDLKTKSAVERQLILIGEAVNKAKKIDTDFELSHASQIISVRNRIVHSYDNIDDAIIWAIIKVHLNKLRAEISDLNL